MRTASPVPLSVHTILVSFDYSMGVIIFAEANPSSGTFILLPPTF